MGNPAGIVLDPGDMPEATMQAIAREVGFNETAFLLPSTIAAHRIRFFTPGHEIPLCGHATVATMVAAWKHRLLPMATLPQSLAIETMAGVLPLSLRAGDDGSVVVEMTQAPAEFVTFEGSRRALAESLGVGESDFHPTLPIVYGSTGTWTLIVPTASVAAIIRMRPRNEMFPDVLTAMPRASIHPFSFETQRADADLHGRHFSSPFSGTVEDPVTGTASGVMGAYLATYAPEFCIRNDYTFQVEQGFEVGRQGSVHVRVLNREPPFSVVIAGHGVYVRDLSISG